MQGIDITVKVLTYVGSAWNNFSEPFKLFAVFHSLDLQRKVVRIKNKLKPTLVSDKVKDTNESWNEFIVQVWTKFSGFERLYDILSRITKKEREFSKWWHQEQTNSIYLVSALASSADNSIAAFPGQNKRADMLSDGKWSVNGVCVTL